MALSLTGYYSSAAAPWAEQTTNGVGVLRFPYPNDSLGGRISVQPLQPDSFTLPLIGQEVGNANRIRLFRDIENSELAAGTTHYRTIFVKNFGSALAELQVYFEQPRSTVGTLSAGQLTPDSNGWVERPALETTAPTAAVYSTPTSGAPLSLGAVAANGTVAVSLRRVLGAGASAYAYDEFRLVFKDPATSSTQTFFFYYTLKSTVVSATITGLLDGKTVTSPYGDTYTIATKNSSAAAADPASNRVFVCWSTNLYNPRYVPNANNTNLRGPGITFVEPAVRTATGTYRVDFRPQTPGHYQMTLDIGGGELTVQRSIEVSPIGAE